ncbi:MAG: hypothetical protein MJZ90_11635 [Bacteroidales bacterium]|nr:hypothetical protein [Bacteroidales bacterium]
MLGRRMARATAPRSDEDRTDPRTLASLSTHLHARTGCASMCTAVKTATYSQFARFVKKTCSKLSKLHSGKMGSLPKSASACGEA